SILWPPNALLFAALLLAPTRTWWLILLLVLPAHMLSEVLSGVEVPMALLWYLSNTSEALIGAAFVRRLSGASIGLDTVRSTIVFLAGPVLAVSVSCFMAAAFVRLVSPSGPGYWTLWQTRFFANTLSVLTFVPIIVTSVTAQQAESRNGG